MTVKNKLRRLRQEMERFDLDAFIVFSADPHMSEYMIEEWQERAWLSAFTGSAGFLVITKENAALWTDARYFVQASIELKDSTIQLMKEDVEGTPDYLEWIFSEVQQGGKVGTSSLTTSHQTWKLMQEKLHFEHIELIDLPLLNNIWVNRPKPVLKSIFIQPDIWAGESVYSAPRV